jgi:hypothetical protein
MRENSGCQYFSEKGRKKEQYRVRLVFGKSGTEK